MFGLMLKGFLGRDMRSISEPDAEVPEEVTGHAVSRRDGLSDRHPDRELGRPDEEEESGPSTMFEMRARATQFAPLNPFESPGFAAKKRRLRGHRFRPRSASEG